MVFVGSPFVRSSDGFLPVGYRRNQARLYCVTSRLVDTILPSRDRKSTSSGLCRANNALSPTALHADKPTSPFPRRGELSRQIAVGADRRRGPEGELDAYSDISLCLLCTVSLSHSFPGVVITGDRRGDCTAHAATQQLDREEARRLEDHRIPRTECHPMPPDAAIRCHSEHSSILLLCTLSPARP